MSDAQYEIIVEGDVETEDLTPALLAFAGILQAANKTLNGNRATTQSHFTLKKKGSHFMCFKIDEGVISCLLDAFGLQSGQNVDAQKLMDLLLCNAGNKGIGLFALIELLEEKQLEKAEHSGGTAIITIDRKKYKTDERVIRLFNDRLILQAMTKFAQKTASAKNLKALFFIPLPPAIWQ